MMLRMKLLALAPVSRPPFYFGTFRLKPGIRRADARRSHAS
jgi:hypothetical protein